MHHPWARIVAGLLSGRTGFGPGAVVAIGVAGLYGDERLPALVVDLCFQRACALPPDIAEPWSDPRNQLPLPEDGVDLDAQCAPVVAECPGLGGFGLSAVGALGQLWPHLAHEERGPLRAALLAGLRASARPSGLDRAQMRVWNRRLGTLEIDATVGMERLAQIMEAGTAEAAFARLSTHLHRPAAQIASVLGSLVATTVDQAGSSTERTGLLLDAAAIARVSGHVPADLSAILLAQLGHALWHQRTEARPQEAPGRHLEDAVLSGDGPAAARTARAMAGSSARFWAAVSPLLPRLSGLAGLGALVAVASRSRGAAALPPEDAATLARALADGV